MRRLAVISALTALGCAALTAGASAASTKTWQVTVTNDTTTQPMSAPLWAVHDKKIHVWRVGQLASSGVQPIVEDAFNTPLLNYLTGNSHVLDAASEQNGAPLPAPIPPGQSRTFTVTSRGGDRYLSMLWMLVNTNDGFTGLDSYALDQGTRKRKHGGKSSSHGNAHRAAYKTRTLKLNAYDGGTENNNGDCAFIPGPGCGTDPAHKFHRDITAEPIHRHPGVVAGSGIAGFSWTDPVATVAITRTK